MGLVHAHEGWCALRIVFKGIHFFAPVVEAAAADHEIVAIETFPHVKSAFEAIAVNTSARLVSLGEWSDYDNVDLCIVAGYPSKVVLPDRVRGINIHPTMLPAGRGPDPVAKVLFDRPDAAGVTAHKLTSNFDAGDILAQDAIQIGPRDTSFSYLLRTGLVAADFIRELLTNIDGRWESARPQGEGDWWKSLPKELAEISGADTATSADRKFRSFYPMTWVRVGDVQRNIIHVSTFETSDSVAEGTVALTTLGAVVMRLRDAYGVFHIR